MRERFELASLPTVCWLEVFGPILQLLNQLALTEQARL